MSDILDFYRGTGTGAGRTFDQIMAFDDFLWERTHDHIQWAFPLPEKSQAQPKTCPVLTEADIEAFKTDDELRARVGEMTARFTQFLANTQDWRTRYDHNHLRITRFLRFLTLIDMKGKAQTYHRMLINEHPGLPPKTEWYWQEALSEHPGFLAIQP